MYSNRLKKMMHDIEHNKAIHLFNFKKMVGKLNLKVGLLAEHIQGRQIKGDLYQITYIEPNLKRELQQLIAQIGHDRITAAQQNLSHAHKVDGSLLLLRQMTAHPQVVSFDQYGNYQLPVQCARIAVILENRQLFLHIERVLDFLSRYTKVPCDQAMDFLLGTGNEISNSLHHKFLTQYQHLYLLFDCDLGGLKTAQSLYKLMPDQPMSFVQPDDIERRLNNVVRACKADYLEKIGRFSLNCADFLKPYAQLIRKSQRSIEQESFLND